MPSVARSTTVNANADAAWAVIGNFNGLPSWLPAIVASEIEGGGPANQVGAIRRLTTADGDTIRETLLEHSDADHYMKYDIIESPMPIRGYVAKLSVTPAGGGATIDWGGSWENDPEVEEAMVDLIGNIILTSGLEAAKAKIDG